MAPPAFAPVPAATARMDASVPALACAGLRVALFEEECLAKRPPVLREPFLVTGLETGAPVQREGAGKRLHNALLVIKAGEIVLRYAKQLLPTYNIFDERRHFEPGPDNCRVLRIGVPGASLELAYRMAFMMSLSSAARLGVAAVLLDEDNSVGVKGAASRGICYTQKSLEILQRLGIYERIARRGIQWSVGRTFAGDDEVYSFDLRQQGGFNLSGQPPFINIQQFYIEGYLVERIAELNAQRPSVDMRWQSRVTGFEQREGHARLLVSTPEGNYTLDATYVIDATGSHTPFHAWCGATMDSKRGDDRWCIADVRFRDTPPTEQIGRASCRERVSSPV